MSHQQDPTAGAYHKVYEFKLRKFKCSSCELSLESRLRAIAGVTGVNWDRERGLLVAEGNLGDAEHRKILEILEELDLAAEENTANPSNKNSLLNFLIFLFFGFIFVLFILLGEKNLLNIVNFDAEEIGFLSLLLLGFVASVSSCSALITGILVSIVSKDFYFDSGKFAAWRNVVGFHVARLISFFIFGGLLGIFGQFWSFREILSMVTVLLFGPYLYNLIPNKWKSPGYLTFLFYLVLGYFSYVAVYGLAQFVNLDVNFLSKGLLSLFISFYIAVISLGNFGFLDLTAFQPRVPEILKKTFLKVQNLENFLSSVLLGFFSFFIPCGFTLSAQTLALSSGSFWKGSFIMFTFALGTLPFLVLITHVLLMFSSKKDIKNKLMYFLSTLMLALSIYSIFISLRSLGLVPF